MMSLIALLSVAEKAAQMAEKDPHGLIMTLVAVSVVFLSLFLLQLCYRFIGWLSTRESSGKKPSVRQEKVRGKRGRTDASVPEAEVAAAIATALSLENGGEVQAAIALALHRYLSESVHDRESYIITIKRNRNL